MNAPEGDRYVEIAQVYPDEAETILAFLRRAGIDAEGLSMAGVPQGCLGGGFAPFILGPWRGLFSKSGRDSVSIRTSIGDADRAVRLLRESRLIR